MVKSLYSVHPAVAYQQAILANLGRTSGRSLSEWLALAREEGPGEPGQLAGWLKGRGLGATTAALVAARAQPGLDRHAFQEDTVEGYLRVAEGYVEAMFSGRKAPLRPLFDALLELGLGLGADMKACPCKTIVPLYRNHVIAELRPATQSRLDLGLALGDPAQVRPASGRLLDTGGFRKKDRITHRIAIQRLEDIDGEVETWLKRAYDLDA